MTLSELCVKIIRARDANYGRKLDKFFVTQEQWLSLRGDLEKRLNEEGRYTLSDGKCDYENFLVMDTPICVEVHPSQS